MELIKKKCQKHKQRKK